MYMTIISNDNIIRLAIAYLNFKTRPTVHAFNTKRVRARDPPTRAKSPIDIQLYSMHCVYGLDVSAVYVELIIRRHLGALTCSGPNFVYDFFVHLSFRRFPKKTLSIHLGSSTE